MKNKSLIISMVVVAGLALVIWLGVSNRTDVNQVTDSIAGNTGQIGQGQTQAPAFSLPDYNDQTVSLSDFAGKPVVVNSWASWCPFCRNELPDFVTVQKELAEQVTFIAINRREPLSTAKKYSDELGVTEDLIMLLDPTDVFYRSIGGFSMPETLFIDKDGNINFHKRGNMTEEEIRSRTKQLL